MELEPIMELQWLQGQLARTQKQVLEIVWSIIFFLRRCGIARAIAARAGLRGPVPLPARALARTELFGGYRFTCVGSELASLPTHLTL